MNTLYKNRFVKCIALLLILVLCFPTTAFAAVEEPLSPCASYYLDSYNTYVYPAGSGEVQVWFSVSGTGYMDEIGSLSIHLYESTNNSNWYHVDTFLHEDNPGMLDYNDYAYTSHVSYQGVAGRYYKAYVCIWAGKDGAGDTRYMWTAPKYAT